MPPKLALNSEIGLTTWPTQETLAPRTDTRSIESVLPAGKLSPREPFVSIVRTCSARRLRGVGGGCWGRLGACPPASFFGPGGLVLKGALMEKRVLDDAYDAHDVWSLGGGESGEEQRPLSHFSNPKPANSPLRPFGAPAGGLTWQRLTGRQNKISRQSGVQHELVFQAPLAGNQLF